MATIAGGDARSDADVVAPARRHLWLAGPAQREIILALLLFLCYGFFRQVPAWNEFSRYDLVLALVDDHTTRIDPYQENTGDKAFYNGHYFSDKAPGSSLLAVPAYALIRVASHVAGIERPDPDRVMHAFAFTTAGVPTVLLALLLLRFLRPLAGEWWALTMTVGYALGSIAFPFATMYFGHAASASFLFAAFYLLWRSREDGPIWRPAVAGLLAGCAVLVDVSAVLGVAVLVVYELSIHRRGLMLMAAGALLPVVVLLVYNWSSFGGPFQFGYSNLVNAAFATGMRRGLLGVTFPKLAVLNEILVGPRGLLRLSPWLALAPVGVWTACRADQRRECLACAGIVVVFLIANAGYYLPLGGWSPGPRFLIPALPFATVLVALAPRAFRPLIVALIASSVAVCLVATATMPNAPEAVRDPLGDLWLPRLLGRDLAQTNAWLRWGLHGIQPLLLLLGVGVLAAAAIYATTRGTRWGHAIAAAGIGLLALLVLAFSTPLERPHRVGGETAARDGRDIAIADTGVTRLPGEKQDPRILPWAQLENHGGGVDKTTVMFSVYAPSGERIWGAWYGDMSWQAGERKRLGVEWTPKGLAPGEYRVSVAVMSPDQRTTYASVDDAGTIRVQR